MDIELPYMVEYSKTGRANCKGCKTPIPKDSLRLAVMVQSAFHDGKQPNWFHKKCFFIKQRPGSVGDIKNFENMRFDDQNELKALVGSVKQAVESKSGNKRSKSEKVALQDFEIEYAKSGRAACRGCELKVSKDEIRVGKTVYNTEVGMKYGGQKLWHHLECFVELRCELGWLDTGENLPGFKKLSSEDKDVVKKRITAIRSEEQPDAKKPKLEPEEESKEKENLANLRKQNNIFFKFRDGIKNSMKKSDIERLLQYNRQECITGDSEKLLDQAADLLAFGAIEACPDCKSTQFSFTKSGYVCNGNISEWTKCSKLMAQPKRKACKIPRDFYALYTFLSCVKNNPETRIIQYFAPSASTISKDIDIKKNPDDLDGYVTFKIFDLILHFRRHMYISFE